MARRLSETETFHDVNSLLDQTTLEPLETESFEVDSRLSCSVQFRQALDQLEIA